MLTKKIHAQRHASQKIGIDLKKEFLKIKLVFENFWKSNLLCQKFETVNLPQLMVTILNQIRNAYI